MPAVTALMDYAVFDNRLSALGLLGMGLIIAGVLVINLFSKTAGH